MELTVHAIGARYGRLLPLTSLLVAAAVVFAVSPERAAAASAQRTIVFAVDTSTSMHGTPLAEAKKALMAGTAAIPAGTRVGLRSFGGPCTDGGIERLPVAPFDGAAFTAAVDSLSIGASGTPIPAALAAAAANLPGTGDQTIVLLSDGGSSCGNPCPVARDLATRFGKGFRIDVVGFRAPTNAEPQLNCVAGVTGGSYVAVSDTDGLQKAIAESAAARVTALRLSPTTFAAASRGGSISRSRRARTGTRVLYTISESVKVRFTIERAVPGRRVNGTCRKPNTANKRGRRCTRYQRIRWRLTHAGREGQNRFYFTGRPGAIKLRPGRYRLVATALDASGNMAKPRRAKFRIVASARRLRQAFSAA